MRLIINLFFHIAIFNQIYSFGTHTTKLFGGTQLGYYYIEVYVGSNREPQSLIVDTGSKDIIFPCIDCAECGQHQYPYFNNTNSSTFQKIMSGPTYYNWTCPEEEKGIVCQFLSGYMEGSSYKGFFGMDNLVFKEELNSTLVKEKKAIFGCATEETNIFYRQVVNGILGLGPQTKFTFNPPTLVEIEFLEKRIEDDTFSICLGRNGGLISFGSQNQFATIDKTPTVIDCSDISWNNMFSVKISHIMV